MIQIVIYYMIEQNKHFWNVCYIIWFMRMNKFIILMVFKKYPIQFKLQFFKADAVGM